MRLHGDHYLDFSGTMFSTIARVAKADRPTKFSETHPINPGAEAAAARFMSLSTEERTIYLANRGHSDQLAMACRYPTEWNCFPSI